MLGGWQLSGITVIQSGLPFNVVNGSTYADNAGRRRCRWHRLAPRRHYWRNPILTLPPLSSRNSPLPTPSRRSALQSRSLRASTGLTFGDAPRKLAPSLPGRVSTDFGLFKRFAFKDAYAFEFRWENFNLFNHPQLNSVSGISSGGVGLGSTDSCSALNAGDPGCGAGFLVLTGSRLPRVIQYSGLRFQF